MKRIWLNILALLVFLAVEFAVLHFMGVCGSESANGAILGMAALIFGALYSMLLNHEISHANV